MKSAVSTSVVFSVSVFFLPKSNTKYERPSSGCTKQNEDTEVFGMTISVPSVRVNVTASSPSLTDLKNESPSFPLLPVAFTSLPAASLMRAPSTIQ